MTFSNTKLFLVVVALGLAVNGYSQSFLTNGLVAYYPFNGNANDATAYHNRAVLDWAVENGIPLGG